MRELLSGFHRLYQIIVEYSSAAPDLNTSGRDPQIAEVLALDRETQSTITLCQVIRAVEKMYLICQSLRTAFCVQPID
jgi:hypothetical protein